MPFFARVVRFDLGEVRHQLEFARDFRGFEVVKAAAQPGLGRWRRHEVLASLAKRRRRDVHGVFLVFTSTSAIGVPAVAQNERARPYRRACRSAVIGLVDAFVQSPNTPPRAINYSAHSARHGYRVYRFAVYAEV